MKKKISSVIITTLSIALTLLVVVSFIYTALYSGKSIVTVTITFACNLVTTFALIAIVNQFDDNNKKKFNWKQILLFDIGLIIAGLAFGIYKMIESHIGSDYRVIHYVGTRFIMFYVITAIMALVYTVNIFRDVFKSKYHCKKKTIAIDGKDVLVNVFIKTNYKGEILKVEIESELDGRILSAKGIDETEVTEEFKQLYMERAS